jgi:hypothetical protein
MGEFFLKFFIGGLVVSCFAFIGDVLKPKSFAGLFAAAPSVALASLGLAILKYGGDYASIEGRSMVAGAVGLLVYSHFTAWLLLCSKWHALAASLCSLIVWFAVTFGLWFVTLGK